MAPEVYPPFVTVDDDDFQLQDTTHDAALALTFKFDGEQSRAVDRLMSDLADYEYWDDWSENDPPVSYNGGRDLLGGEDVS